MYGFEKRERGNARFTSCFKREPTTIQRRSRHHGACDFVFFFWGWKKIVLRESCALSPLKFGAGGICLPTGVAATTVSGKNVHWWSTSPRGTYVPQSIVTWSNKSLLKYMMYKQSLVMRNAFYEFFPKEKMKKFLTSRCLAPVISRAAQMCFKRMYK